MKQTAAMIFIASAALALASTALPAGKKTYGHIKGVEYVRNYDGDTITFNLPGLHPLVGEKIPVRVRGIDTPEIKGKCIAEKQLAERARATVRNILKDADTITLLNVGRGKYYRIVADVNADGVDVGMILLGRGLAVEYDGKKKTHNWCGE